MMQVELFIGDKSLVILDCFLKSKGFKFNPEIGKRQCVYTDGEGVPHNLYWNLRATLNKSIVNTFEGDIFPYEKEIREIIAPSQMTYQYTIAGEVNERAINEVIKTLFNHKFEVVGLSKNGTTQIFKRKHNCARLDISENEKFMMTFNCCSNMSRSLLNNILPIRIAV
jgi:hypothetical protein